MRRVLLTVAALAIPLSAATVTMTGGTAWAKGEKSITCKTVGGNPTGTVVISSCNGNTGGGASVSGLALATGGVVTWNNGKTTTIGTPTLSSPKNKKCSAAGDAVDAFTAPVTADTTGLTSLGTASGEVCVNLGNSTISDLKPIKIT
ncbi:MAG TPA: hypothetical protein VEJ87_07490 [Acidimicrobiales bacterium]|nr:hypothetical protein [Acidimicrobiales bacterium]